MKTTEGFENLIFPNKKSSAFESFDLLNKKIEDELEQFRLPFFKELEFYRRFNM